MLIFFWDVASDIDSVNWLYAQDCFFNWVVIVVVFSVFGLLKFSEEFVESWPEVVVDVLLIVDEIVGEGNIEIGNKIFDVN